MLSKNLHDAINAQINAEYLKKANFIESYRLGNEYEGGMGATVVILK